MSERVVVIYVSRNFRDKVKVLKKEKSYETFLSELLNGNASDRKSPKVGNRSTPGKRSDSD